MPKRSLLPDHFLVLVLVGALGGGVGFAYLSALRWMETWLSPQHASTWSHLFVMIGVGLMVAGLTWWLGSSGDVELLVDNVHVEGGAKDLRALRSLLPTSLLCIAVGGAAGPEAPLVQTTGSLASWLARKRLASVTDRRILTITGMAAGFTVLFGVPLGAAIFALEILHRRGLEYYEALMPAVIGSLSGYLVYMLATGCGLTPVWHFPDAGSLRPVDLAWAAIAGVAAAVIAAGFTGLNLSARRLLHPLPAWLRPVLGGAVLGVLGMATPWALTFGETQLSDVMQQHPVASTLALAAVAKLLATTVTLACGWRGGFIIPLFFMGAAVARLMHIALPQTNEIVLIAAMMAATNAGVTKTPLGSMLVVTGMAGLHLMPTTLIAVVVSMLLTHPVGMIHSQRDRFWRTAAKTPRL
ncbi:MAG: chloride channel protein [Phycisphaeraceae bacterium]|nr:chloride channel protein [Phycisphaeraceae bacterium]